MKIHELITPETWIKNVFAQTESGLQTIPEDGAACRFCALGWLVRVYGTDCEIEKDRLRAVIPGTHPSKITIWNDYSGRTFEEVKEAFRKADL